MTNEEREELKRRIEVMQACLDGRPIEVRSRYRYGSNWYVAMDPNWDWTSFDYRIKREPREWWVNVYLSDCCISKSKQEADQNASSERIECIHVREVLEDGK